MNRQAFGFIAMFNNMPSMQWSEIDIKQEAFVLRIQKQSSTAKALNYRIRFNELIIK